jgi:hypothetical protein
MQIRLWGWECISAYKDSVKNCVFERRTTKKRWSSQDSSNYFKHRNKNDQWKRQLLLEMQNRKVGNNILFQQEITSRGC